MKFNFLDLRYRKSAKGTIDVGQNINLMLTFKKTDGFKLTKSGSKITGVLDSKIKVKEVKSQIVVIGPKGT